VAINSDTPLTWHNDTADNADQGSLAGTIRAQQCKDLTLLNIEVDVSQRMKTRGVSLAEIPD